jgi:hypothetical protein
MTTKHLTIAAALVAAPLLAALAQPAFATTYTESISSIVSSTTGQPSFSGLASFTGQSLSSPLTQNPFFTATPKSSGSGTQTSTITVHFSFSDSGTGIGSLSETGAFSANYTNTTDWVIWTGETGGTGSEQIGGVATFDVTLSDNAMIQVQLYDANDWNIQPQAGFTLLDAPTPAPEPGSLVLLGTAFAGLGLIGARRRRSLQR